jgi:hypothetical protein
MIPSLFTPDDGNGGISEALCMFNISNTMDNIQHNALTGGPILFTENSIGNSTVLQAVLNEAVVFLCCFRVIGNYRPYIFYSRPG